MRDKRTIVDQRVNVLRKSPLTSPSVARNLERIAWLMDRAIKVPGTKITIGLDALLGLVPVGGDLLTGSCSGGSRAGGGIYHYRVPKVIAIRMMGNVLLDTAVGAFPLLGDLFDVAFKANTRNLALLDPYRRESEPGDATIAFGNAHKLSRDVGMPWRYLVAIGATLLAALILVFIGLVTVVRWFL